MENVIPKRPLEYVPKRKFINHKDAVGALDATLIMISKPMDKEENNMYFSGRHKKHGVKLQVLVAPDGFCIHFGGILPGGEMIFTCTIAVGYQGPWNIPLLEWMG